MAGLAAAVLLVADLLLLSSSPTVASSAHSVTVYLEKNHATVLVASYLGAIDTVVLLPFLASLKGFVGDGGEAEWRWTVTLLSGAIALAVLLGGSALLAASAELSRGTAHESAVGGLFAAAKLCFTFALVPFAGMILANARTMASARTPVRWLVRFGTVIGLLALVSGSVVFVDNDWFGPGEPIVAAMGLLIALWLVAVAATILEDGRPLPE